MTQKLTLPIQVGKKYVRRDGAVAEITPLDPKDKDKDIVNSNGEPIWKHNGQVWKNGGYQCPADIVADYVEISESIPNSKQAHPHAELMMEYAKDAATMAEPWKNWEIRYNKSEGYDWCNCVDHPAWNTEFQYRRKQPRVCINGIECVAGVREPVFNALYYVASITPRDYQWTLRYTEDYKHYADRGLLHRTEADAIAMAKAMLNFQ